MEVDFVKKREGEVGCAAVMGVILFVLLVCSQQADMKEPWQSSQPAAGTPEE